MREYSLSVTSEAVPDQVDAILGQWARERPDLDASPMGIFGRVSRLAPLLLDAQLTVFRRLGLDFASFDVLATLRRSGGPCELTPGDLARSMMVTPGAVAQRLAGLEERGLVTRRHDNPDRRKVTVALTPEGRALIDDAVPQHLANEHRVLAAFTADERQTLAALLRRLLAAVDDAR